VQDVRRPQAQTPPLESPLLNPGIERTLTEHSAALLDLRSLFQSLDARMSAVADTCISLLSESTQQADQHQLEIRQETARSMRDVEAGIASVRSDLSNHLASQSSRLQDLFKDLPALAELSTPAGVRNTSDLARLEESFVAAARQMALPSERLEALQDQSSGLLDAVQDFVRTVENTNRDDVKKRFTRVVESAAALNKELFNLRQLAVTQKHGIFVEMSLLEHSHLAEDIAAALTRETLKLGDPEGYYLKRLAALRAHACVAGIDLADLDADAERRNHTLQEALAKLLQALGMTPIDPCQNDRLQAAEHQVVQFVRRVPGVQPGVIAHTMVRGLQHRGDVIRKASVLLYE